MADLRPENMPYTTGKAARELKVSQGTVQDWFDKGYFGTYGKGEDYWWTGDKEGEGHRRISVAAVRRMKAYLTNKGEEEAHTD